MSKPHRATVIVPLKNGILLAETFKGMVLLPGGQIERNEVPIAAAARELMEETGLEALGLSFIDDTESHSNVHHVFEVTSARGKPRARSDAKKLHFQSYERIRANEFPQGTSPATIGIIKTYYDVLLDTGRLDGGSGLLPPPCIELL